MSFEALAPQAHEKRRADHLIAKAPVKEGSNTSSRPAVDIGNKAELDTIAFGNVAQIIFGPQGEQEAGKVRVVEEALRKAYVDNKAFGN
jgi:hypothetical protein